MLRKNSRMSLTNISRQIQVPVSTIFERLKKHENTLITRHTCLIDFNKLGYSIRANLNIKLNNDDKDKFESFINKHKSVNSAYRITTDYDYLLETLFKDMLEMETFKAELTEKFKIKKIQVYFVLDDICREHLLTDIMFEQPKKMMVIKS